MVPRFWLIYLQIYGVFLHTSYSYKIFLIDFDSIYEIIAMVLPWKHGMVPTPCSTEA